MLAIDRFDVLVTELVVQVPGKAPADSQRLLQRFLHHPDIGVREIPIIGVSGFHPLGSDKVAKRLLSRFGVTEFLPKTVCDDRLTGGNSRRASGPTPKSGAGDGN